VELSEWRVFFEYLLNTGLLYSLDRGNRCKWLFFNLELILVVGCLLMVLSGTFTLVASVFETQGGCCGIFVLGRIGECKVF
jgi:hypothetical protein